MDMKRRSAAVRKKDREEICGCGGKTYAYGAILRPGWIKIYIACYKCHLIIRQYDRETTKRLTDKKCLN